MQNSRFYIAGHKGLIGSALLRKYRREGFTNIIVKTREELDLFDQQAVIDFFKKEKPEYVILAAAKVGGINVNIKHPASFMFENLLIQNNVMWAAHKSNVKKLLYISCGCAYPTNAKQPLKEEYILTGPLETTNEGFAIAKIAGMKVCEKIQTEFNQSFISCIVSNTYGENDHYDENRSHVISALIKKFHQAKKDNLPAVTIWGTGNVMREFIYVDDLADALFLLMEKYLDKKTINIGSGEEISIRELSETVQKVVGYLGKIQFDQSKPDGMQRRVFDTSKMNELGFKPHISLEKGIKRAYQYYLTYSS